MNSALRIPAVLLFATALVASAPRVAEAEVAWRPSIDAARVEAANTGKLLLLHFYTKSCVPCKKLEGNVFSQPHVGPAIEQAFVPVKVDADSSLALVGMYRIKTVPTDVVLDPQGKLLTSLSCPQEPDKYLEQLNTLVAHYRQTAQQTGAVAGQPVVNRAYAGLNIAPPQLPPAQSQAVPPQVMQNPYGQPRPNYMAGQTEAVQAGAGQAQSAYQNQMAQSPAQPNAAPDGGPQVMENPYAAAAATAAVATTAQQAQPQVGGRYAAQPGASTPVVAQQQSATPPAAAVAGAAYPTAPASTQAAAVQPQPQLPARPQLPAGAAPLGLDGYCPVTLRTASKWVAGNPAIGMEHRGRTYLFMSEAERQQFAADPDAYSPVFAGQDPVMKLDQNLSVEGARRFGCNYAGRMYLFSSQESLKKFAENPSKYDAGVRQAMSRLDGAGDGIMRR